jgi:hypothetical protein
VNPHQKLAQTLALQHRDGDLRGVRLVAAGFDE